MADLFWTIATSFFVLGAIGLLFFAAAVVGYFPLLKWFPGIGQYVPVGKLVALLSAALLCFLLGVRVSDERAETKNLKNKLAAKTLDYDAANEAAFSWKEATDKLVLKGKEDAERIAKYEELLKARQGAGCTLVPDDFDGVPDSR